MDNLDPVVQNFEDLGYQKRGVSDDGSINFRRLNDDPFTLYGMYNPDDGIYRLDFVPDPHNKSPQVLSIEARFNESIENRFKIGDTSDRRQIYEMQIDIFNDVKKELGIPEEEYVGMVGTIYAILTYYPHIILTGSDLNEVYERLKTYTEKLDYTI